MKQQWFWLLFAGLSALIGMSVNQVQAQEQYVTIALPIFAEALVDEAVLDDFEAQYGVQVEFIYDFDPPGTSEAPQNVDAIEDYVETVENYMSAADVILVDAFLNPEITRAGYALDLAPLVSADSAMNPNDFYTTAWDSFMWDAGMWAVPIASEPLLIDYNIEAFDANGLTYPNENWTIDDFAFAARELTQYDENGDVSLPGMLLSATEVTALLRAIIGTGFYDSMAFPETPALNNSQLADAIDTWVDLLADGVVRVGGGGGFGNQFDDIGIQMSSGGEITVSFVDDDGNETAGGTTIEDDAPERGLAELPGGNSIVLTTGLAISSGTTIPDMAYNLVRFLSESQAFADLVIGSEPARRQYFTEAGDGGALVLDFGSNRSEEQQAFINQVLDTGLPTAELRFSQYLNAALTQVQTGANDAVSALQEAELDALDTVQAMDDLEVNITVTSGIPIAVAEGEVSINFGIQSFVTPLPNDAEWDEAIADFVASDPQVGAIDLDLINIATSLLGGNTQTYDCTYYPNTLFINIDTELLLAVDPLLFSDPNYDVGDLPFGALGMVQVNGISYGLPITIQPQLLQYNPDTFQIAGLPEPIGGWTISEFGDALVALDQVLDDETVAFESPGFDNTYLLMLVAAQGGLPIDTRTSPPTINFTSPETLEATQTILDWFDAGYIDQSDPQADGGGIEGILEGTDGAPIRPTFFAGFSNADLSFTTFPTGIGYTPLSFDVGAGYISIDSDVPEACFRWLSFISRRPELFPGAMPAQISLLDTPEVQSSLSQDAIEAYRSIANQMSAPDVVNFNATDPFLSTWLTRAIDAYLNEDADLLTELQDADQYTRDYLACTGDVELEVSIELFQRLNECVEQVDSAIIE